MVFSLFYKFYFQKFGNGWMDLKYSNFFIKLINFFSPLLYKVPVIAGTKATTLDSFIVSLTTFPKRIDKVWITIESILRQTHRPGKVILWLSEDEFPNGKKGLPGKLLNLEKKGLHIRFCKENLMPHKKYYYTLKEFPDKNIIVVDDDVIYPPDLLRNFYKAYKEFPDAVCAPICREINVKNGNVLPYKQWNYIRESRVPAYNILNIGVGGCHFPPNSLSAEVFNIEIIKEKALTADDLWLKIMSVKNQVKVMCIAGCYSRFFVPVLQKGNVNLTDTNIRQGKNDIIFRELLTLYNIPDVLFDNHKTTSTC